MRKEKGECTQEVSILVTFYFINLVVDEGSLTLFVCFLLHSKYCIIKEITEGEQQRLNLQFMSHSQPIEGSANQVPKPQATRLR